jgi:hypothetical protein
MIPPPSRRRWSAFSFAYLLCPSATDRYRSLAEERRMFPVLRYSLAGVRLDGWADAPGDIRSPVSDPLHRTWWRIHQSLVGLYVDLKLNVYLPAGILSAFMPGLRSSRWRRRPSPPSRHPVARPTP